MSIFTGSLLLGLIVAVFIGGMGLISGESGALEIGGILGATSALVVWLMGSLFLTEDETMPVDMSYDVSKTAVITPQTYIKGQVAVSISSLLVGSVLIYGAHQLSFFAKTTFQVLGRDDLGSALPFWAGLSLLLLLAYVNLSQLQNGLIGSHVVYTSLKANKYILVAIVVGSVILLLSTMYYGFFLAKMIDILLLLLLSILFAVIVGMSHAICWDYLGLHPQKLAEKFTDSAEYLACERREIPFLQHIVIFWRGVSIAFFMGIMIPPTIHAIFLPSVESEIMLKGWLISFVGCLLCYPAFYYKTYTNTPVVKREMYARVIHGYRGQTFLHDINLKQNYIINGHNSSRVVNNQLHEVWFVEPFMLRYVVAVRTKSQQIKKQVSWVMTSTNIPLASGQQKARITRWLLPTLLFGVIAYIIRAYRK